MSDYLYTDLDLVARHEPDYSVEIADDGTRVSQELPGFISFGVEVDGVFVPILRRKAAGLFADIARLKAAAPPPAPPTPPVDTTAPPVDTTPTA